MFYVKNELVRPACETHHHRTSACFEYTQLCSFYTLVLFSEGISHVHCWRTNISYLEISLKSSIFHVSWQRHSSSASRELFKLSKDLASFRVSNEKFSFETRLESDAFEPLINFLAFLVQKCYDLK